MAVDMAIRPEELLTWKCSAAATSMNLRAPPKLWNEMRMCEIAEFQTISTPITIRELTMAARPTARNRLTTPIAKTYASSCQTSDPEGFGVAGEDKARRGRHREPDQRDRRPDEERARRAGSEQHERFRPVTTRSRKTPLATS